MRSAAEKFQRKFFVGFGDDSIAQLGGAHVACEWCSNVLTKILQRPRVASYLEQSTRYIPYDEPISGDQFRFYRDPELGPVYERSMAELLELPALSKDGSVTYRPNPVNQTHRNAQIVKDVLKADDPTLSRVFLAPLVCIVSVHPVIEPPSPLVSSTM